LIAAAPRDAREKYGNDGGSHKQAKTSHRKPQNGHQKKRALFSGTAKERPSDVSVCEDNATRAGRSPDSTFGLGQKLMGDHNAPREYRIQNWGLS
jgi:hypothetical protein